MISFRKFRTIPTWVLAPPPAMATFPVRAWCCCLWVTLPLVLLWCPGLTLLLAEAEQVALVEVFLEQRPGVSALLRGDVLESGQDSGSSEDRGELEGELLLVRVSPRVFKRFRAF